MSLKLIKLTNHHITNYEDFLEVCPAAMVYHSLAYRRFLKEFLPSSVEDHYLLAFNGNQVVAALPCFLTDGPYGVVINSLPFFGSHGSILLHPNASRDVVMLIVDGFMKLCEKNNASFATVIDTPFFSNETLFKNSLNFQLSDQRIGQISTLPEIDTPERVSENLISSFHTKTRNHVRKGLKSGLIFGHDDSLQTLRALHSIHEQNILAIGGAVKPLRFFKSISSQMVYDKDYRIYTARTTAGEIVSALLLLYFKDYVDYFCPATLEGWRAAQPLSALIYLGMLDAVLQRQSKQWNWGGTWLTQDGVYDFKSRWGTQDYPYQYYTRVFPDIQILNRISRKTLLQGYPWFYSVPYSALAQ